mmetsp:Transcript_11347/g.34103  ORF Transcript_11347/g.34103 Transcript_11347/m.34103 type:complete len:567 (+) Transcript_11347:385-2085(+)
MGPPWISSLTMCGAAAVCLLSAAGSHAADYGPASVLQYHKNPSKDGYYVDSGLKGLEPSRTQPVPSYGTPLLGQSYAQQLYVDRGSQAEDLVISATQENIVTAHYASTGQVAWVNTLADPVPSSSLPCGNIAPVVGVLSTPVIDEASGTLILSAKTTNDAGETQQYKFFGLDVVTGVLKKGYPVDVAAVLAKRGVVFQTPAQLQRGGLLMLNGVAYAGYGGNSGDCQEYRGRVVGVTAADPSVVYSYNVSANKGAIWAPGGPASDGASIFVGTGNTQGVTEFSEGNAVLKLSPTLEYGGESPDFFAPTDWLRLDDVDLDLGTAGPVTLNLPGSTPPELVFIGGKEGIVYLLDRTTLGGFDGSVASAMVVNGVIITAPAIYNSSDGTYAAVRGAGASCPEGNVGDLVGLKLTPGNPPTISTAWCANATSKGNSPMATTASADGKATLWIIGANDADDYTLNAYNGETGALLYQSEGLGASVSRFHTPIYAKGRIYLATTERPWAFDIGAAAAADAFVAPPLPPPTPTTAPAPTAAPTQAALPRAHTATLQVFIAAVAAWAVLTGAAR